MKKILTAAILVLAVMNANAQLSNYLGEGKSGVGIAAIGEKGYDFSGFGGGVGVTLKGKWDFTFSYTFDTYGKEANNLLTDKATSPFYLVDATYWLFKHEITPGIEANFGLRGGFQYSTYKDFITLEPVGRSEYIKYSGVEAGIVGSVAFKLAESWYMEPKISLWLDGGTESWTENQVTKSGSFVGLEGYVGMALIKRTSNGAFFAETGNFFTSYGGSGWFDCKVGYAFAF